jgi:anti-sigma B factor antagonist
VVDLRQVSFIDSVGLAILLGARRRLLAQDRDGSIDLVCDEGLIVRILRLTGLDRVFPLHASLTGALGGDSGQRDDQS